MDRIANGVTDRLRHRKNARAGQNMSHGTSLTNVNWSSGLYKIHSISLEWVRDDCLICMKLLRIYTVDPTVKEGRLTPHAICQGQMS